jgi:hypothetical protein
LVSLGCGAKVGFGSQNHVAVDAKWDIRKVEKTLTFFVDDSSTRVDDGALPGDGWLW